MPKKKDNQIQDTGLNYRALAIAQADNGTPASLDAKTRSVEVVGATENPVPVYDWERGVMVAEVLLMSGCQLPETRQSPLLDTHNRYSTTDVIGSYREMMIDGDKLIGRAFFSDTPEAQGPYQKVSEGHLTDFSIGYRVAEATFIPDGQRQTVGGKTFDGPIKVVTNWTPKELSACPIGADEMAKARSAAAPAQDQKNRKKEATEMDKKVREFLESRGLAKTATEEEALRFLEGLEVKKEEPPAATKAPAAVDAEKIRAEAVRAEQERITEIRSMCDSVGHPEEADAFIRENKTVEAARKTIFDKVVNKAQTLGGTGYRAPIEMGKDEKDKFRAAAEDSLFMRAGRLIEKPAPGARELIGFSLRELARECLRLNNQPIHGNVMEMVGRAFTTSDFPYLLANVANKELAEAYETAPETWQVWCATGSVSDFKTHSSARASETDDLDEIKEDDEYKYDKVSTESREQYQIATYGKLFAISRQTIINDDLGAFTDIPRKHGEAASRKVGDVAYAVLTANAAMGDGVALFYSTHGNIGTSGAPSETTIAEAIKLMKLQKDVAGKRRLNIRAEYFIAPAALEGSAEVFFNSKLFAGSNAAATRANPYADPRFTRVYDARLDDDSSVHWFVAGPKGKTVKVFFLNGNQSPYLETKQGWSVDGVELKVRIDAGAKAMDWKALVKNANT